jgi:hypothetical protein
MSENAEAETQPPVNLIVLRSSWSQTQRLDAFVEIAWIWIFTEGSPCCSVLREATLPSRWCWMLPVAAGPQHPRGNASEAQTSLCRAFREESGPLTSPLRHITSSFPHAFAWSHSCFHLAPFFSRTTRSIGLPGLSWDFSHRHQHLILGPPFHFPMGSLHRIKQVRIHTLSIDKTSIFDYVPLAPCNSIDACPGRRWSRSLHPRSKESLPCGRRMRLPAGRHHR